MPRLSQSKHFLFSIIKRIFIGCSLLLLTLTIGTIGYIYLEGYSIIDALFFTVITISTVGFGVIQPLSDQGKLFTILLIITSIVVMGFTLKNLTQLFIEGYLNKQLKTYSMRKKIERLKDHIIVCGYGRNGYQACIELNDHHQKYVIIEKHDAVIDTIQENPNLLYVQGDAALEEILELAGIRNAKALITTLQNDAENMYVVLTAREMNPKLKIISRASDFRSDLKLKRAGADNVIMPDRIGGQRMAKLVVQEDVVEFMEFLMLQRAHNTSIQKISCETLHSSIDNKSLKELRFRAQSGVNIIGFKNKMGVYICNPDPDYIVTCNDDIFALGTPEQLSKLKDYLTTGS